MFAVVVDFKLASGQAEAFMPLMQDNAATSLRDEAGCIRFDICSNPDQPEVVHLYELYIDRAAFDAHLASAHFAAFDAATGAMIADKTVQTFESVFP